MVNLLISFTWHFLAQLAVPERFARKTASRDTSFGSRGYTRAGFQLVETFAVDNTPRLFLSSQKHLRLVI
jgi:hypothetical protein